MHSAAESFTWSFQCFLSLELWTPTAWGCFILELFWTCKSFTWTLGRGWSSLIRVFVRRTVDTRWVGYVAKSIWTPHYELNGLVVNSVGSQRVVSGLHAPPPHLPFHSTLQSDIKLNIRSLKCMNSSTDRSYFKHSPKLQWWEPWACYYNSSQWSPGKESRLE